MSSFRFSEPKHDSETENEYASRRARHEAMWWELNAANTGTGGNDKSKGMPSWLKTALLIGGGLWLYSNYGGQPQGNAEQPQAVQRPVPAPVAVSPAGGGAAIPQPAQTASVPVAHDAAPLDSAQTMDVYRGVIGMADFRLPDAAKAQFDAETRALLASGQKILHCVYRTPRDGYVSYDFWQGRVPQAALSLRAIDPNADIRFMGAHAFNQCPPDADTALYVRQRSMGIIDG